MCDHCSDSPDSIDRLEQHARVMKIDKSAANAPRRLLDDFGRISLYHPLGDDKVGNSSSVTACTLECRQPPPWMQLLPSFRNAHIRPPTYSVLQRRYSFPYFASTRYSSPFSTPPEMPIRTESLRNPLHGLAPLRSEHGRLNNPLKRSQTVAPTSKIPSLTLAQRKRSDRRSPSVPQQGQPLPSPNLARHNHQSKQPQKPTAIALQKSRSTSSRRPPSAHRLSTIQSVEDCKTDVPISSLSQSVATVKPPYLPELTGFLTKRSGKLMLPSRINQMYEMPRKLICSLCGSDSDLWLQKASQGKVQDGSLTEQRSIVCASCNTKASMPGGWL